MYDTNTAMEYYGVATTLRLNIQNVLFDTDNDSDDIVIDDPVDLDQLANGSQPEVCSSIDVVPTLLNLFGIRYDSRLLIENDYYNVIREYLD